MNDQQALDRIVIQGIQFYGYHGVPDEEQATGHRYAVDVEITTDLRTAGRSDSIADTINYAAVTRLVVEIGTVSRFRLIETLADRIATAILDAYSPHQVLVRVKKLLPPMNGIVDFVAVEVVRTGLGGPR